MLAPREKLIHGSWIIGVLTIAVIVQASLKAAGDENTATLIGVVTGLVSMVVGIIAIFYSFISNASLSETSSRLHDSSAEIRKSSELVISKLEEIGSKLSPLNEVAKHVSDIKTQLAAQGSQPTSDRRPDLTAHQFAQQLLEYFTATSSWLGLLCLYAAIKRHEMQKPFNAYRWAELVGNASPDYAISYIICTASVGLIGQDQNRFLQSGNLWLTFVLPNLLDKITHSISTSVAREGLPQESKDLRAHQRAQTDIYIAES